MNKSTYIAIAVVIMAIVGVVLTVTSM